MFQRQNSRWFAKLFQQPSTRCGVNSTTPIDVTAFWLLLVLNLLLPEASRNDIAGVLLHDIGKTRSNLSTLQRVVATIVGPRTRRFALYHQHEQIGVELLQQAGSHSGVIAILNQTCNADVAAAFRAADNI
jgi:hypothetical protein